MLPSRIAQISPHLLQLNNGRRLQDDKSIMKTLIFSGRQQPVIQKNCDLSRKSNPIARARSLRAIALIIASTAALTVAIPPALAAKPSHWTHTTEADFRTGKFEHVVATNLGDLKLSRDVKTLLDQDASISAVYCMVQAPDGTIYAGTGPQGVLLRITGEKVETLLKLKDDTNIASLAIDAKGRLLIGTVGDAGKILALPTPATATADTHLDEVFADKDIQYIWAMVVTDDGMIYAATGPTGQLIEIKPDGTHRTLLTTGEQNIVSLISDGKDTLYAGTDPHGLVYRINRKTNESFVMYDAAEPEITALALDAKGNLFVAASEASEEPAPTAEPTSEPDHGRPEVNTSGKPVPSIPPEAPTPPAKSEPTPGGPNPIPSDSTPGDSTPAIPTPSTPNSPEPEKPIPSDINHRAGDSATPKTDAQAETPAIPNTEVSATATAHPASTAEKSTKTETSAKSQATSADTTGKPDAVDLELASEMDEGPDLHEMPHMGGIPGMTPDTPTAEGNAVYRIDPNGFVTEVFREPATVLSLIEQDGSLLVGTGGEEGNIYQIQPGSEETILLAKVDPKQVTCMIPVTGGRIMLGLANSGALASMTTGYATKGTFTSPVLDATQVSQFGNMHMTGQLPDKTTLLVQTRSGNVQEADDKTWSPWSEPVPARQYLSVASPSARFLQYRLILNTTDPVQTPVVDDFDIVYQLPNIGPKITSITVAAGEEDGPHGPTGPGQTPAPSASAMKQITWEASDPTGASLQYSIFARTEAGGPWIKLKDKVTESQWLWNTRLMADGRYFLRLEASNAADSPDGQARTASRISNLIIVDNTPPMIGDLVWQKIPGGAKVSLKAVDRTGIVSGVHYCIDSADDWQAVPSSDKMYDSPSELVSFELHNLTPGQHHLAVRATDNQGNQSYENLLVTVDEPAK